jgi:hypothetical protein
MASDVRQGRAYVELYVKNSALVKGLNNAKKRLTEFGAGIASTGKWMMGVGAALVAPFTLAARHFDSVGSKLFDMSKRTGLSTNALSELGYAAEQSGADLETVEKSVRKMQKTIADAASGEKTYVDALKAAGTSYEELAGLSPEEQFEKIAAGINAIADPTMKAAAAQEIFGRSGTMLLPMFADLNAQRERAKRLGLSISPEEAAAADALGDAWGDLRSAFKAVAFAVGGAVAKNLTEMLDSIKNVFVWTAKWIRENKELVTTILKVGAGVIAGGAAFFILGQAIVGVGAVLGVMASMLVWAAGGVGMLASVLGMAISPAFAIKAALVAIGIGLVYLARNTTPVKAVGNAIAGYAGALRDMIGTVVSDAQTAWGGIKDALAAGDIEAAVKIVTATLILEWTRVTTWLTETWQGFLSNWNVITDGIARFMIDALTGIETAWVDSLNFMSSAWDKWVSGLYESSAYRTFAKKVVLPFYALLSGHGADELADLEEEMDRVMNGEQEAATTRIAQRDRSAEEKKERIESDAEQSKSNLDPMTKWNDEQRGAKIAAAQKELEEAKKERDAAVADAARKRREAAVGGAAAAPPFPGADPMAARSAVTTSVAGTFNARAALQMGGGSGIQERILKEAVAAREQRKKLNAMTEEQLRLERGLKFQFTA